ncbi:MAG: 2-amino-4-hydroxy-6-hydroxymethyldihydropteridine diphosphokinase [Bryobacteraceae bacterium]|nr:2-amino-4-hydroxy-6-hydroxymethyldihydropteridine diphosphokinase [Bryobacteraceae bacterium]MDW8376561.1 2-amino-4-hydroxy-6-hydroxymethyldihydropteridine diphosphokinase [Bryobacterales bacterium]
MKTIYLGLGSNLGEREANLQRAIDLLAVEGLLLRRVSSVYESDPLYVTNQPPFLNLVVEAETNGFPRMLLRRTQRLEREMGRVRTIEKGPRLIDIDILLFGNFVVHAPELVIPHPRMHERRFVLEPLCEIAPELRHPITKQKFKDMFQLVRGQSCRKLALRLNLTQAPASEADSR